MNANTRKLVLTEFDNVPFDILFNMTIEEFKTIIEINAGRLNAFFEKLYDSVDKCQDETECLKQKIVFVKFSKGLGLLKKDNSNDKLLNAYFEYAKSKKDKILLEYPVIENMIGHKSLADIVIYESYVIFRGDDGYLHLYQKQGINKDFLEYKAADSYKGIYKNKLFKTPVGMKFSTRDGVEFEIKLSDLKKQLPAVEKTKMVSPKSYER